MIIVNVLLVFSMLFLVINLLTAITAVEKIITLYGLLMIVFAITFINFNLEQGTLIDLALTIITAKITILIIATKLKK